MQKQFRTVTLGSQSFRATWDMTAWATMEKISGVNAVDGFQVTASNVLDALWAAIDAAAASEDQAAPVSRRKLGTLITNADDMHAMLGVVAELITLFMPEGKATTPAVAVSPLPSGGATSSQPATLESASASSGG